MRKNEIFYLDSKVVGKVVFWCGMWFCVVFGMGVAGVVWCVAGYVSVVC